MVEYGSAIGVNIIQRNVKYTWMKLPPPENESIFEIAQEVNVDSTAMAAIVEN